MPLWHRDVNVSDCMQNVLILHISNRPLTLAI